MLARETIRLFDLFLEERGLRLEAVVIGGAALALLGVVGRETRDCDVLHPTLPEDIAEAAVAFARERQRKNEVLGEDWLNNGPSSLVRELPLGWEERLRVAYQGQAVRLTTLGRVDLLLTKLFALCDRGEDLEDCVALAPSDAELEEALPWVLDRDASELWPDHVKATFESLERRLKYDDRTH